MSEPTARQVLLRLRRRVQREARDTRRAADRHVTEATALGLRYRITALADVVTFIDLALQRRKQ